MAHESAQQSTPDLTVLFRTCPVELFILETDGPRVCQYLHKLESVSPYHGNGVLHRPGRRLGRAGPLTSAISRRRGSGVTVVFLMDPPGIRPPNPIAHWSQTRSSEMRDGLSAGIEPAAAPAFGRGSGRLRCLPGGGGGGVSEHVCREGVYPCVRGPSVNNTPRAPRLDRWPVSVASGTVGQSCGEIAQANCDGCRL